MSEPARTRGMRGESLAAQFLADKGYRIIERNYRDRISRGEIDLIARDRHFLVFIEVKAGQRHAFGPPETWVDIRKQRRVIRTATRYIQEHNLHEAVCRFDVIGITFEMGQPRIIHIENAFWGEF